MEVSRFTSHGENGERVEVERLAEEFAARLRRGERPEIEEYIFAHPSLASEIRAVFSTLVIIEELG
ncbi:MAG TPA: hypothetical protein VK116_15455, partial [Planctomycetota bacterium]|nr:hypothetical protein [Planctomycetota bacterium]